MRKTKNKRSRRNNLKNLNSHINFSRESKKTSSRKWDTKVTCCSCKIKFTLPFKPRRPDIYCDSCFKKKGKGLKKAEKSSNKYNEFKPFKKRLK